MGEPIHLDNGLVAYGRAQADMLRWMREEREEIASEPAPIALVDFDWTQIKGVSDELARALNHIGLNSPALLIAFVEGGNELTDIPGIGKKRASDILAWAKGA